MRALHEIFDGLNGAGQVARAQLSREEIAAVMAGGRLKEFRALVEDRRKGKFLGLPIRCFPRLNGHLGRWLAEVGLT